MQFASVWVRGLSPGAGRQGVAFPEGLIRRDHSDPTLLKPPSLNTLKPQILKARTPRTVKS
eukprot:15391387-Alexandrium_andersonii.AAC.1